jgi:hypothetical protein
MIRWKTHTLSLQIRLKRDICDASVSFRRHTKCEVTTECGEGKKRKAFLKASSHQQHDE